MAPLIEVNENILGTLNTKDYTRRFDLENKSTKKDLANFIYVPSINLYVAKQKTHLGKNWFDCHRLLQQDNKRMLIIPEFLEFLKYTKINFPDIYKEITEVGTPWRAEWLDAYFKFKDKKLYINYNHLFNLNKDLISKYDHLFNSNESLISKNSEILDANTLMQDKIPGINLEDLLNSAHTNQGLPNKNIKSGDLYYWSPRSDNNSVARFDAYSGRAVLDCYRNPSDSDSGLGVRAVKEKI